MVLRQILHVSWQKLTQGNFTEIPFNENFKQQKWVLRKYYCFSDYFNFYYFFGNFLIFWKGTNWFAMN